ncbi:MAG TPA: hypothetical protein VFA50_20995 [Stellaceae bacterium]|nr:hypothetical protein [Stellaceae bacterium]
MPDEESNSKSNFRDEFLKANANLDFIGSQFADVLRDLMRAVSSDDPTDGAYRAAKKMDFVADLLSRCEEKFGFRHMFLKALEEFRDDPEWDTVEHATVHAAQRGIKYLVERSCSDHAARGRASKREHEFLSAIKEIEEMREYRRRKPRIEL